MTGLKEASGFDYLEKPGADKTIVFFHGHGANAFDFFSITSDLGSKSRFLFPQAPIALDVGWGQIGYSWFPLNVTVPFAQQSTKPIEPLIKKLIQFLSAVNCSFDNLILGGFSQGGIVAAELALHLPQAPTGLLLLSTTLVDEVRWQQEFKRLTDTKVLISHGEQDDVLAYSHAQRLDEVLTQAGLFTEFVSFKGGHTVPDQVIKSVSNFIK